jgi:hypothetical protein
MMYPITASALYIQTDQIISMTFSTLTILMSDGTTHVVTAPQFADIIAVVNAYAQN